MTDIGPGDLVRCVDTKDPPAFGMLLVLGALYTVERVFTVFGNDYVSLRGGVGGWYLWRFRKDDAGETAERLFGHHLKAPTKELEPA